MTNSQSNTKSVKSILVVEDQNTVSEMLRMVLQMKGYTPTIATDFLTAQELLATSSFDLVLLDINLPNGNGLELLQEARETRHLDVPVIILSALKQETNVVSGLNLGANDYVTKPFSPRELMLRIERLLEVK